MANETPLSVLGIGGSLRSGSYNRALLRAAQALSPERMRLTLFDLAPLPFYNADVEAQGDPAPVAAFKAAIRKADSVLVATPEYNHGMPGVLKNALDWASRPHRQSPLLCKPAAVIGATAGRGSTWQAQAQMRETFVYTGTCTLAQPEFSLSQAGQAFDETGQLISEDNRTALQELLEALVAWIDIVRVGERYQAVQARLTAEPTQLPRAS
jgi:chromate reductase